MPASGRGCDLKDPSDARVLRQCACRSRRQHGDRTPRPAISLSKSPRASLARAVLRRWPTTSVERRWRDELVHDEGRHADLLQGLGHGPARGLQSWMAPEFRCVGGPDVVPRLAWLPLHRARSPGPRPVEPAMDRQRHGHLRRRPGRARPGTRSEERDSRRALHGRRRGGAVHRPARYDAGLEGRPDQRDPAADAADARPIPAACR